MVSQGGTVATIQYDGGDFVEYIHHPANADASVKADANDIIVVVNCLNSPGSCPDYQGDIDASGIQGANDIIEEVNLLNGSDCLQPVVRYGQAGERRQLPVSSLRWKTAGEVACGNQF